MIKGPRISVRSGLAWIGLGIVLFLVGAFIAMGDIGTRDHPLPGAVGVAVILTSVGMVVWGLAQVLASWDA